MDGQTSGTNETLENQAPVDPWIAAFAALESKGEEAPAGDAGSGAMAGSNAGSNADASGADGQDASLAEGGNGVPDADVVGGLDPSTGADLLEGGESSGSLFEIGVTDESIQQFEQKLNEDIRNQAINEVAQEFIKRGIRNTDGRLGATLDDPDICKRDKDGVPHFYNPETGREFTGDNPRREAKQWVDDYNEELARVFNNTCEQYEKHLTEESAPQLAVMKFAPKYEKLDDIRKGMFDNVIEDYEIRNSNNELVGYSCDLDKALALVERQIAMIQSYAKQQSAQSQQKAQPSGPALDMKTSSGAIASGEQAAPRTLAEAMERKQDEILAKMRK